MFKLEEARKEKDQEKSLGLLLDLEHLSKT